MNKNTITITGWKRILLIPIFLLFLFIMLFYAVAALLVTGIISLICGVPFYVVYKKKGENNVTPNDE